MNKYPFQKEPNDDKEMKYYWLLIIGVAILSLILLWNFPTSAQDTTERYQCNVSQYVYAKNPRRVIYYYEAVGADDEQPISIIEGGGGGTTYNHKEVDSIARHRAKCGYDQIEFIYTLNSMTDVLFSTEQCLFKDASDVNLGLQYVFKNPKKFGYPDTSKINGTGLSFGSMVMEYFTYHYQYIDKQVGFYGAVLNLNMINKNVPTLLIHGSADKTLPIGDDYAFKDNPFIGGIVFVHGSGSIYNWCQNRSYDCELNEWKNYGHGFKKVGSDTNKNMRIANNDSINFLYK